MRLELTGSEHELQSAPATSRRLECMHHALTLALLAGVLVQQVEVSAGRVEHFGAVDPAAAAAVVAKRLRGCPSVC